MTLRQRVVIPAHYRADVEAFAMEGWFESDKHCPQRKEMLKVVGTLYQGVVSLDVESESSDIRLADSGALETVANMMGLIVRRNNSLADYISDISTLPNDKDRWYDICCAAGWLIMQIYVRELVRGQRGGD
ncbi:MAG TPA: hypothetical protein VGG53_14765 [Mycobacterium sp.]|uniref:hypothetical protein n=1 Tax=Mycobacterium sp. TaxID=1785 RepID=UPI002F40F572